MQPDDVKRFPVLRYFSFDHLAPGFQEVARPFAELAVRMSRIETSNPAEIAAGLRKLLEAKDCAVRAALP